MKKLALVLCTVMAICCAGSAFAATSDGTLKGNSSRNSNSMLASTTENMPSFRAGDILNFEISGLSKGSQLIIISYKTSGDNIGNDTVQYIDQRTIEKETDSVKYVVRDINDGIYKVAVKDNGSTNNIIEFYYKVGTPSYSVVPKDNNNYYVKETYQDGGKTYYAVGYLGKAVFKSNELDFADYGIKGFGFKYTDSNSGTAEVKPSAEQLLTLQDKISDAGNWEVNGSFTFYYINTISGISDETVANSITAEATMYDSATSTAAE